MECVGQRLVSIQLVLRKFGWIPDYLLPQEVSVGLLNLSSVVDSSPSIINVVFLKSWLDRLRGVSRVHCIIISCRHTPAEAAKMSMEEFDVPL